MLERRTDGTVISRRSMLGQMAAATAFLSVHDAWVQAGGTAKAAWNSDEKKYRIRSVRLNTSVPLEQMVAFYEKKLGLKVKARTEKEVTFVGGASLITFVQIAAGTTQGDGGRVDEKGKVSGEPFYHFAFNIPENKILAARRWQLERTILVPTPAHMRDNQFPDDVRHFSNWNAHSIFFYDPAYNIVEYIARHDLKNAAANKNDFDSSDLLGLSEIGFVVDVAKRESIARQLGKQMGLKEYPSGATPWAMGDEHGLLLVLGNLKGIWGENTPTPVKWGVFPTEASISGAPQGTFAFEGMPYRIVAE